MGTAGATGGHGWGRDGALRGGVTLQTGMGSSKACPSVHSQSAPSVSHHGLVDVTLWGPGM